MGQQTFRQRLGQRSERIAADYLRSHGYAILQTNVRFPVGEIDILAQEGETLCFVEVRATSSLAWGGPLATVTTPKQRRLIRAARWYLQQLDRLPRYCRFDVLAVSWAEATPAIELIQGAFDAS